MRDFARIIINILHIISFVGLTVSGLIGVIYEVIGWTIFERFFSKIGISKGFELVWVIGAISLIVLLLTYFIKTKIN